MARGSSFATAVVRDFSDGLNTQDAPWAIAANQLADCQDVLVDRPGHVIRRGGYQPRGVAHRGGSGIVLAAAHHRFRPNLQGIITLENNLGSIPSVDVYYWLPNQAPFLLFSWPGTAQQGSICGATSAQKGDSNRQRWDSSIITCDLFTVAIRYDSGQGLPGGIPYFDHQQTPQTTPLHTYRDKVNGSANYNLEVTYIAGNQATLTGDVTTTPSSGGLWPYLTGQTIEHIYGTSSNDVIGNSGFRCATSNNRFVFLAGRLFEGQTIYFSGADNHVQSGDSTYDWDQLDAIQLADHDNQYIRALATLNDDLVVFKESCIWVIHTPSVDTGSWSYMLRADVGTIDQRSVQHWNGNLVFASSLGIHLFDGISSKCLSDRIQDEYRHAVDGFDSGDAFSPPWKACGMVYGDYYVLSILDSNRNPVNIPGVNRNACWCIHLPTGAITRFSNFPLLCSTKDEHNNDTYAFLNLPVGGLITQPTSFVAKVKQMFVNPVGLDWNDSGLSGDAQGPNFDITTGRAVFGDLEQLRRFRKLLVSYVAQTSAPLAPPFRQLLVSWYPSPDGPPLDLGALPTSTNGLSQLQRIFFAGSGEGIGVRIKEDTTSPTEHLLGVVQLNSLHLDFKAMREGRVG